MGHTNQSNPLGREPWPYNPLVTLIRLHGAQIIVDIVDKYEIEKGFKASNFDVIVQVMIVACSYAPEQIWRGKKKDNDIAIISEYITKQAADMALDVMEQALEQGRISLNAGLIRRIALQQVIRLHQIHNERKKEFNLPSHRDKALDHFAPGAELTSLRLTSIREEDNLYEGAAVEKHTKEKVIFRPVSLQVSRAYIESFHYLHTARDDDYLAFGAFLEGHETPLALVTYASVSRVYKQNMLKAAGIDPKRSLELTRAWNSESAPKNTMSVLYGYAHANIQRLWQQKVGDTQPLAILTAVNPNLGFKGSAFRAVGFGVIGEKPTSYHYVINNQGQKQFTLRRNLSSLLRKGSTKVKFTTSSLPLLPTKELAVILDGKKRRKPITDILYYVTEAEYQSESQSIPIASLQSKNSMYRLS